MIGWVAATIGSCVAGFCAGVLLQQGVAGATITGIAIIGLLVLIWANYLR